MINEKQMFIICLLVITFNLSAQMQYRHSRYNDDFARLTIGPTIAGMAFMTMRKSNEKIYNFGYLLGGELNIRPITQLGLTTGLAIRKVIPGLFNCFTLQKCVNLFHFCCLLYSLQGCTAALFEVSKSVEIFQNRFLQFLPRRSFLNQ